MKFGYTIVYVADVVASIAFYEQAFGFSRRMITPENDYGELHTGETVLAFASEALVASNGVVARPNRKTDMAAGVELAFITDDVAAAVSRAIAAGAAVVTQPQTKPWGQTVAWVRDPDGVLVELCTAVG
jgi:lactoylglutathione lyase